MNSGFKNIWSSVIALTLIYASTGITQPIGNPPPGAQPPIAGADGPPPNGFGLDGSPDAGAPNPFAPPPLPAHAPPPASDPRNLDGTWYHEAPLQFQITRDMFGNKLPFNDAGNKVMQRRVNSLKSGTPFVNAAALCIPVGQPQQMDLNMPFHIFQSEDRLDFEFEEFHDLMQVVLEPAKKLPPGYMGSSLGHWDGDTLVVETSGYTDGLWLDVNGTPASKHAKLTQRIRKVKTDHWFLEIVYTLDDPTYYTRPWSWVRDYSWRPDMTLFKEYNCELQTGAQDGIDPSLVPEPQE